ncbi:MAG: hypothetical protein JWO82_1275 [Akkermansiaceae bacterium]|nr:hypothetical protein [Akkermansiaceae bacterium]
MAKTCAISGNLVDDLEAVPVVSLRPSLLAYLRRKHPGVADGDIVSRTSLDNLRAEYIEESLPNEIGEVTDSEREVIESLRNHELLAERPNDEEAEARAASFGDRLADRIASFGGSWTFILSFITFLGLWVLANCLHLYHGSDADPYPFIFLNLLLSCIAALQAPVIMMSQNRGEARDRRNAMRDYQINLKAELEIRHLHEKMDHLLVHQSERLLEIQQFQTELLQRLVKKADAGDHHP